MTACDTYNLIDSAAPNTIFQNKRGPLICTVDGTGTITRQTAILAKFPKYVTGPSTVTLDAQGNNTTAGALFLPNFFWTLQSALISGSGNSPYTVLCGILPHNYEPSGVTWSQISGDIISTQAIVFATVFGNNGTLTWQNHSNFLTGFGRSGNIALGYGYYISLSNGAGGSIGGTFSLPDVDACYLWT